MAKAKWSVAALPERRKAHKIASWKPIMDAAYVDDAAAIKRLIAAGADPSIVSTTPAKYRPLHRAIEQKKTAPRGKPHEAAVKVLLAGGADPTLRGAYDQLTPLALAAMGETRFIPLLRESIKPLDIFHACVLLDDQRVAALLKKDSKLASARDVNNFLPLHYAAASALFSHSAAQQAAQLSIARRLLEAGADANGTYTWAGGGDWPLSVLYMCAGKHDNPALTELLLEAGANPCDNESVYHASDEGHDACLAMFEKYVDAKALAQEASRCLPAQMHWNRSRGMKWLLEHGADPNQLHPHYGNSALHSAAMRGSSDAILTLLLSHGADPSRKNRDAQTAIQLARAAGHTRVVKFLSSTRRRIKSDLTALPVGL